MGRKLPDFEKQGLKTSSISLSFHGSKNYNKNNALCQGFGLFVTLLCVVCMCVSMYVYVLKRYEIYDLSVVVKKVL